MLTSRSESTLLPAVVVNTTRCRVLRARGGARVAAISGTDLAKPTTTQRALDRVYWEIRWMDLMDSPAAFPCRTILLL
jgi:hypothetical protein